MIACGLVCPSSIVAWSVLGDGLADEPGPAGRALQAKYLNLIFPIVRGSYGNLPALVVIAMTVGYLRPGGNRRLRPPRAVNKRGACRIRATDVGGTWLAAASRLDAAKLLTPIVSGA